MKRISHIVFFAAVASTLGVILYFFIAGASSANETAKAPVKYRSLEASAQPVPAGDRKSVV